MSDGMTRRDAMKLAGGAAVLAAAGCTMAQDNNKAAAGSLLATMPGAIAANGEQYTLPPLPYATDALEPLYDSQTLQIHHDKHHQGYVNGLNATLQKLAQARDGGKFADVQALSESLAFNGSGHVLHTLFWNSMTPDGSKPSADLQTAMRTSFGSVEACQQQFAAATKAVMASGWGVLGFEPLARRLVILQAERHQDNGLWGVVPLLVCDVWEHAYYLKYQNNRGQWVDNFMKMANWDYASKRLAAAEGL